METQVLLLALDSAADAIAIIGAGPEGRPERSRFDYVNHAFEQIYQVSRADVLGMDLATFFAPRSTPEGFAQAIAALSKGEPFSHTRQLPRPDGTQPWIHVNFQPFDDGRWIYIIRDITQIRLANVRIEQLLSAVERATEPIAIFYLRRIRVALRFCERGLFDAHRLQPGEHHRSPVVASDLRQHRRRSNRA